MADPREPEPEVHDPDLHDPDLHDPDLHDPDLHDPDLHDPDLHDEVDRLVAAWQQERPDLDTSPMEVLSRVTRLAHHLDRSRRLAFSAHGLEPWEFDVLAALRRAGDPYQLSPGQLLRETMVTSGTMTNRVDRLAARGLVGRENHPEDRRGVRVTLTPDGLATVDAAFSDLIAAEHTLLAGLPTRERAALTGCLRQLLAPYETREPVGP